MVKIDNTHAPVLTLTHTVWSSAKKYKNIEFVKKYFLVLTICSYIHPQYDQNDGAIRHEVTSSNLSLLFLIFTDDVRTVFVILKDFLNFERFILSHLPLTQVIIYAIKISVGKFNNQVSDSEKYLLSLFKVNLSLMNNSVQPSSHNSNCSCTVLCVKKSKYYATNSFLTCLSTGHLPTLLKYLEKFSLILEFMRE